MTPFARPPSSAACAPAPAAAPARSPRSPTSPPPPGRPGHRALLLSVGLPAWCGGLAASVWLLARLAARLPAPPVLTPDRLGTWLATHDPAAALFGLLRVGALALAWYLVAVTVVGALARLTRLPAAIRAVDWVTVAPVRRLLHASLSAGLVLTVAPPAAYAVADDPDPPVLRPLSDGPPPAPPSPPTPVPTWTVGPGQSFWSIARHVLADHPGRPPDTPDIAPYWRILVAANRDRLKRPADPNLIYAGQVLVVPPP